MIKTRGALADRLAHEADPVRLEAIVAGHLEDMDATLFELLAERVDEQRLCAIARLHLRLANPAHLAHFELYETLVDAQLQGQLDERIDSLGDRLDADFVDTLLQSAESGLSARMAPEIPRGLLDLTQIIIGRRSIQALWSAWWLRDAAWHLGRRDPQRASESIERGLAAEAEAPAPLVREALVVNRAVAAFLAGRFRQAVVYGHTAVAETTDPELESDARCNLAMAYAELGEIGAALVEFESLMADPVGDFARRVMGRSPIDSLSVKKTT